MSTKQNDIWNEEVQEAMTELMSYRNALETDLKALSDAMKWVQKDLVEIKNAEAKIKHLYDTF